jgi:hypothetical protein
MQSQFPSFQPDSRPSGIDSGLLPAAMLRDDRSKPDVAEELAPPVSSATRFRNHFVDSMEMYADAPTVAAYLDDHADWFHRCALPMRAEPLGNNGYVLTIGKFGNLGYEIEPKIGLHLLPGEHEGGHDIYRIETIEVPDYTPPGYVVDFRAAMELVEQEPDADRPALTHVQWQLDLTVDIQFPKFIQALPVGLVQRTGEIMLEQIVRQASRRLTHKVQEDFHSTRKIEMPKKGWFR